YITPEITGKLPPGFLSPSAGLKFADIPNGLAAVSKVPVAGWAQIAAYFGFVEFSGGFDDYKSGTPGDYGFKVLTSSDPAEKTKKLSAELANGRLAMMAIIGMFFQDGLTGSAWGDWANYTASPLRAFESELGVQAPVGFWDPAGFTKDGNADNFARRRQTELKHGRIAMLATMGYITPEFSKWPGYLSPTLGIKFADVPNGLAAISKVPISGWTQILLWGAYCETSQDQSPGTPGAAGDFGWKVLTSDDAETKTKKLAAELANGRLAMMAIIGMFFQDGLTGSAWGDWANYTASPLRAFESELGVQDPVGFWDPVGFTSDGDVASFKRRRSVELKHGRISMMATMGLSTATETLRGSSTLKKGCQV
ncbi:FCPF, partial [Symbiodinium sp. KB8]